MQMEANRAQNLEQNGEPRREVQRAGAMLRGMAKRLAGGERFADLFEISEEDLSLLEAQAYQLYRKEQYERARIVAEGLIALDPNRMISQLIVGDVALGEYDFRAAVEHLRRAHELAPESSGIQARLGEALARQGRKEEARRHLQEAVENGSRDQGYVARAKAILAAL